MVYGYNLGGEMVALSYIFLLILRRDRLITHLLLHLEISLD